GLEVAGSIVPDAVPKVLAHDAEAGLFAMEYLDPSDYPVWKMQFREGIVDLATARQVGRRIGVIHAATAHDSGLAKRFANDALFHSIRLEPYLVATVRPERVLSEALAALSRATLRTHLASV